MAKLTLLTWIANAAAVITGPHGEVIRRAHLAGCSRQSVYDHARKVRASVEAEFSGGPTRAHLIEQNEQLRHDNEQLWDWLTHTIDFPPAKRDEFSITATAMGLSLSQIHFLLAIVLGICATPSRSTLHGTIQAAGRAAGHVLKVLDDRCKTLVLAGCLDEIFFHHRPVLVGIEPTSLVWFLGVRSADSQAATWAHVLGPWTSLDFVVTDAGMGLQGGIAQVQRERREAGHSLLESGLDVFHTAQEAHRVLSRLWKAVERGWENAEVADRKANQARQSGRDMEIRRWVECAAGVWSKTVDAFQDYEAAEKGWRLLRSALQVVRPDGRLNDCEWATHRIASALESLPGPEWSKVRSLAQAPGALTFLDRLHRQLQEAEPRYDLRNELIQLWWLRRQRPRENGTGGHGGSGHVAHLVQMMVCQKQDAAWSGSYMKISRVIRQAVRASSAAECLNSTLRMHQSRHRTMTQGLLDLKRLYWNSRPFASGKRKGRCPYALLGLELPGYRFADLLRMPLGEASLQGVSSLKVTS